MLDAGITIAFRPKFCGFLGAISINMSQLLQNLVHIKSGIGAGEALDQKSNPIFCGMQLRLLL